MSRKRLIVTLAILNIFIPFLGIPRGFRTFLIVLFSAVIAGAVYGLDKVVKNFFLRNEPPLQKSDGSRKPYITHTHTNNEQGNVSERP